jgi:hypothetical protein
MMRSLDLASLAQGRDLVRAGNGHGPALSAFGAQGDGDMAMPFCLLQRSFGIEQGRLLAAQAGVP